jgi:hypothetical protein
MKIGIIMPEKQKQSPRHLIYLSVHIAYLLQFSRHKLIMLLVFLPMNALSSLAPLSK